MSAVDGYLYFKILQGSIITRYLHYKYFASFFILFPSLFYKVPRVHNTNKKSKLFNLQNRMLDVKMLAIILYVLLDQKAWNTHLFQYFTVLYIFFNFFWGGVEGVLCSLLDKLKY